MNWLGSFIDLFKGFCQQADNIWTWLNLPIGIDGVFTFTPIQFISTGLIATLTIILTVKVIAFIIPN